MKVKNTSGKVICFGGLILLPNETGILPKEFENCDVIDAYVETDTVVVVKERTVAKEVDTDSIDTEKLGKMKKDELVALCEKFGVEVGDEDTKAILVEKLTDAKA